MKVLTFLGQKPSKSEVKLIIWVFSRNFDNLNFNLGSRWWSRWICKQGRIPNNVQEMHLRRDWTRAKKALQPCAILDVR